ncbi:TPA: DUF4917 family protein, partial [Legionella pneumophila subsp. pneumophila]|nr:DUF4917 family protein [Legionella pneumophila subsp. pneumophila]
MNITHIMDFSEVLNETQRSPQKKPALLLGNGFSMAFNKSIFSYKSLYEQALEKGLVQKLSSSIPELFESVNTFDFEYIMQVLKYFGIAGAAYSVDENVLMQAKQDEALLKNMLVEAITNNHPDNPNSITLPQYKSCLEFLSNFKSIYSLNYDLLLYWVVMKYLEELGFRDGFCDGNADEEDYYQDEYVVWPTTQSSSAEIYFLHGALHLFDAGHEIRKFCWSRTGIALKEQILQALGQGMFPLFVSEGDAGAKLKKILHNGYLLKGLRSLTQLNGSVVAYGVSFKKNDQHIIDAIIDSTISHLYVSIFGDPTLEPNKDMINMLSTMVEHRNHLIDTKKRKNNLEVHFYN